MYLVYQKFLDIIFSKAGDWGLGIGDSRSRIGPNPQSPIPNPQSPIPNPLISFLIKIKSLLFYFIFFFRV